jgi:YesN/AraC family two-component response regulator
MTGKLEVEIEGKLAQFQENEICFINSMAYHRESIANSNCLFLNISIKRDVFNEAFIGNVSMTPLQKFLRQNIMKYGDLQNYLKFTPDSPERIEIIQNYLFQIISEVRNRKPGYMDISKGYIIRLMDELTSGYHYNFSAQDSAIYAEKLFESISDFMKEQLSTVNMALLSDEFHFHPNHLNHLIKKQTGKTYSEYLIFLRIERAKLLLTSTNLSIEEIMWLIGYNNKGFFYKKFEEQTGTSPAKYRKGIY